MTPQTRLARVGALALSLALLWSAVPPLLTWFSQLSETAGSTGAVQLEAVRLGPDGSYTLTADAPPAPHAAGQYQRYGFVLSPVYSYSTPFSQLHTSFFAVTPTASAAQLDLRISADGSRWSGWETDVLPGSTTSFVSSGRFAQYRVRLFGNASPPTVANVQIQPRRDAHATAAYAADEPLAPTYKVRATRQGMVGGRTANGYVIKPHDRFVSLPSWRALSSSRTSPEYFVRLTANGRSTVVPVMDVGPWNEHDDYWNVTRRALPRSTARLPAGPRGIL